MENITILIALYGAAMSTISLGWNIYNILRDRSKLSLSVSRGLLDYEYSGLSDKTQITIKAVNRGRRPVTLSGAGIRLTDGQDIVSINGGFPIELQEGQSHQVFIPLHEISREHRKLARYAWMRDAADRLYKVRLKKEVLIPIIKGGR